MRDRSAPLTKSDIGSLDWDKGGGLIPAIVQDAATAQILMLGYMSLQALEATLEQGQTVFFSRSRQQLWRKGETSGNVLNVRVVHADCDSDALLVLADPMGPTCHLGTDSCFGTPQLDRDWLEQLSAIIASRAQADPDKSYSAHMLAKGPRGIGQKVGEEAVELALAAAAEDKMRCIAETADLIYHIALLMQARDFSWSDVAEELERRRKPTPPKPTERTHNHLNPR